MNAATPVEPARYLEAALAGRRAEAADLVRDALSAGWPLRRAYELLADTQHRLGDLWASATISVAEEHMASAVTEWVIARIYEYMPARRETRGRVLIAGVEGELHALAARFAADLLELDGWDVMLVGTNVPDGAILSVVGEHVPDVVGLSVTMPFNVPPTVALVQKLRARTPELRIVLGGRAVNAERGLARELRVDLYQAHGAAM